MITSPGLLEPLTIGSTFTLVIWMGGHLCQFSLVMTLIASVIFCPALLQLLAIANHGSLSIGVGSDLCHFSLMMPLLALMLAGPGLGEGISAAWILLSHGASATRPVVKPVPG